MPSVPSTLALTNIPSGSQIISTTHNNNYTAIQTAVNALIADLSSGTAGAILYATSSSAVTYSTNVIIDNATSKITLGGDATMRRSSASTISLDFCAIAAGGGGSFGRTSGAAAAVSFYTDGEANDRLKALANGTLQWSDGTNPVDTNLVRSAADTLKTDDGFWAAGGMVTKTKAGIPTDADLVAGMQQSGAFILDTTNSRIYFRVGSTWKFAALT